MQEIREQADRPRKIRAMRMSCCAPAFVPTFEEEDFERFITICRALGDETRVRILDLLAQHEREVCVCEIVASFDLGQPTISHHLKILREAGLVGSEKRGLWVHYYLNKEALTWLRDHLGDLR